MSIYKFFNKPTKEHLNWNWIWTKLIANKLRVDRKASRLALEANKQAKLAAAHDEKIIGRITDEL